MKLVHLSDIHIGTEDPRLVSSLVDAVNGVDPDLVVATGDFTQSGTRRQFRRAEHIVRSLAAPVVATPGNHDTPLANLWERLFRPWRRYNQTIGNATAPSYADDTCAVVGLNTARPLAASFNWSHGSVSASQIEQAAHFFEQHASATVRLLAIHHPFVIPDDMPGFRPLRGAEPLLDMLAEQRVHGVLSGHLHRHLVAEFDIARNADAWRVSLIQAGSPTSSRNRDDRHSFGVIEIHDQTMSIRQSTWNDTAFGEAEVIRRDLPQQAVGRVGHAASPPHQANSPASSINPACRRTADAIKGVSHHEQSTC